MRATKHEGVDVGGADRGQEPLGEDVHLLRLDVAGLDELHESGAGGTGQLQGRVEAPGGLLVGPGRDGPDGADDADPP